MDTDRTRIPSMPCPAAVSRRAALGRLAGGGLAAVLLAVAGWDVASGQGTPEPRSQEGEQPNRFVLAGEETRITYDATAAGGPRLAYDDSYDSQTFVGDEIHMEDGVLGRLVSVHLEPTNMGDIWLTLLLPTFNPMTAGDGPASFATLAIDWGLPGGFAGPAASGGLVVYGAVPLQGTAELVEP